MIDATTNKLYIRDKQDEFQFVPGLRGEPGPSTVSCYDFSDYENDLPAGTFNQVRADFDAGKVVFVKWPIPSDGGYTPQLPADSWIKLAYHNYSDSSNKYFYSEHFLVPNADGDLYQYYLCLDDDDFIDWYPADYNAPILTENSGVKKNWDTSDSGKILGINSSGVVSPVQGGLAAHIIDLTGLTAWGPIPSSIGVTLASIKAKVDTGIPTYIKLDLSNKSIGSWIHIDVVYLKIVAAASNGFVTEPLITEPSYSSAQNDSCFIRFIGYVNGGVEIITPQSMFTVPYTVTCPSSFPPSVVLNAAQVNDGFVPKTFNTSYSGKILGIGSNGKVAPVDPPANTPYYDLGSGTTTTAVIANKIIEDYGAGKDVYIRWNNSEYGSITTSWHKVTYADEYEIDTELYIGYQPDDIYLHMFYIYLYPSNGTWTIVEQDEKGVVTADMPRVTDVQINGTSKVSGGVVNIPYASTGTFGVVRIGGGLKVNSNSLYTDYATSNDIKEGTATFKPITPTNNYVATFYGLATAAGDRTQASSSNPTGIYTDTAKQKIQELLGVVATNQGVESAGKILGINSSGMVEAIDAPTGGSLPIAEEAVF